LPRATTIRIPTSLENPSGGIVNIASVGLMLTRDPSSDVIKTPAVTVVLLYSVDMGGGSTLWVLSLTSESVYVVPVC